MHLDGNFLNSAVFAAGEAKKYGVKVSLDAGGIYDGIEKLLPLTDILIPSAEFALAYTKKDNLPDAMFSLYELYQPSVLVITDGNRGGYYFSDGKINKYSAFSVDVKDSNGAGDVFHGAFLVAFAAGKTVAECCRFASAVAALKCRGVGCKQSIPDLKETERFLNDR